MKDGYLIPGTPIAVDYWDSAPNARIFFLTHAQLARTSGLTSSWNRGTIYCSDITAKILHHKLGIAHDWLYPLSMNKGHLVNLDSDGIITMSVTLICANHCPGSVMFLFEGYFGRILYTGDFRFQDIMFASDTVLGQLQYVDDLYLDNTFNATEYDFPSQETAQKEIIDLVVKNVYQEIVLPVNNLGKEELFEGISIATKRLVHVTQEKMETLRLLDRLEFFTTDRAKTNIRLIPKWQIVSQGCDDKTLVIVPTAAFSDVDDAYKRCANLRLVIYSDHSSYSELHQFVRLLRPKKIIPIVSFNHSHINKNRQDFSAYTNYLTCSRRVTYRIPESVEKFMKKLSLESLWTWYPAQPVTFERLEGLSCKLIKNQKGEVRTEPQKRVDSKKAKVRRAVQKSVIYETPSPSPVLNCDLQMDEIIISMNKYPTFSYDPSNGELSTDNDPVSVNKNQDNEEGETAVQNEVLQFFSSHEDPISIHKNQDIDKGKIDFQSEFLQFVSMDNVPVSKNKNQDNDDGETAVQNEVLRFDISQEEQKPEPYISQEEQKPELYISQEEQKPEPYISQEELKPEPEPYISQEKKKLKPKSEPSTCPIGAKTSQNKNKQLNHVTSLNSDYDLDLELLETKSCDCQCQLCSREGIVSLMNLVAPSKLENSLFNSLFPQP